MYTIKRGYPRCPWVQLGNTAGTSVRSMHMSKDGDGKWEIEAGTGANGGGGGVME